VVAGFASGTFREVPGMFVRALALPLFRKRPFSRIVRSSRSIRISSWGMRGSISCGPSGRSCWSEMGTPRKGVENSTPLAKSRFTR